MPLLEGELEGKEESSVCEGFVGRSGVGFGSCRDVQHELGTGSEICGDCSRDDGEDQGIRAEPSQKEKVMSSEFRVRNENPKDLNLRTPN